MDNLSKNYTNTSEPEIIGPLKGATVKGGISLQIERTAGSGAVGTFQVQISNSGKRYENQGAAASAQGITQYNDVTAGFVQVLPTANPAAGTEVKVTLVIG